jgi:ribosomal protein S18 acetylase RimI-like enzyme
MKSTEFITDSINPQVFRRGFEKTKEILNGKYMLKAYHGPLPYSPTKKINQSENFHIDAFTAKGNKVGNVVFKVTDENLEAVFVTVDPKYRRQGIAKEMYIFAKELGNDIIPSSMRIYNGNDFGKGIADLYKGGNIDEN